MITYVEIALRGKYGMGKTMKIDLADLPLLKRAPVGQKCNGGIYPYVRVDGSGYQVARDILGLTRGDDLTVDHLNGDTLDNRRENLEAVTNQENIRRARLKRKGIAG